MSSTAFPLGAYVGNPDNSNASGEASFEAQFNSFVSVMGARPQFMNAFVDYGSDPSTWAANQNWWAASWAQSPVVGTGVTPVIGVPMATNAAWGNSDQFFKDIVAGKYDADYQSIVNAWAGNGYKTIYLRLGYEMNGTWFPWSAGTSAQTEADWVAAFQHLSTLMKQAGTADGANVQIVWNPSDMNWSGMNVASLYPGDRYVDVIASDDYSPEYPLDLTDWASGGTTQDASFAQWSANPANREHFWTYPSATQDHPTGQPGVGWSLQDTIDFARAHGKAMALAETGAGADGTTNGPSDDPAFPAWLAQQLSQPDMPPVAFVNVWDYNTYKGGDNSGNWDFSSAGAGKPQEAASWAQYFGAASGSGGGSGSGSGAGSGAAGDPSITVPDNATVTGGAGHNQVSLGSNSGFISQGTDTIAAGNGPDTIAVYPGGSDAVFAGGSQLAFIGGDAPSTVIGGSGSSTVFAGAGGGVFQGGQAGHNALIGQSGSVTLYGGGEGDTLYAGGSAGDLLVAGSGNETLNGLGSSGNDTFYAGPGNAMIGLGSGSDLFAGGSGNATVFGGAASSDTYAFVNGQAGGNVQVWDFSANDRLALFGYGASPVSWGAGLGGVMATLPDHTTITFVGLDSVAAGQIAAA